jgi:hypothetical protein
MLEPVKYAKVISKLTGYDFQYQMIRFIFWHISSYICPGIDIQPGL